jgi:hypothetical protein
MSAIGPKQTWPRALHMSAFGGKADIGYGQALISPGYLKPTLHGWSHKSTIKPRRNMLQ